MDPAALRAQLREYGIDLSKTGLHRLETTEPKNPNLKIIEAIAEITNVSPGWILFGKGPTVPDTEVGAAIRSRVIDTVGAGDAFFAVTAPLAAAGGSVDQLAFIGTAAGAIKVGIVGHRKSVEKVPVLKFLTTLLK